MMEAAVLARRTSLVIAPKDSSTSKDHTVGGEERIIPKTTTKSWAHYAITLSALKESECETNEGLKDKTNGKASVVYEFII